MGIAFNRAIAAIAKIRRNSDKCLIIHYACQSLYDDREGLSPSVSNIAFKDFNNDQTVSFAAHFIAERKGIPKEQVRERFPEIEQALLEDFFEFVRNHNDAIWLHWNMTNMQFGFEMLAHRYNVLTGKTAPVIDIDSRINIADILWGRYGENYVSVPHMPKLMALNGGARRDFVQGAEEVELFKAGEYARLHASTVSKVKFFSDVVERVLDRKLKTESSNWYVRIERRMDGLTAKIIALLAGLYTIGDLTMKAVAAFSHH